MRRDYITGAVAAERPWINLLTHRSVVVRDIVHDTSGVPRRERRRRAREAARQS